MTTSWLSVAVASTRPDAAPDPDRVTPGLAGFLVVFLLALATLLLIRSMIKHLRKVQYSPEPLEQDAERPEESARLERAERAERADGGPRPPTG